MDAIKINQSEVESAKCNCCGLVEECTPAYIAKVRERFEGQWICGLCAEAVKDEVYRSERRIGMEEALSRHMSFCKTFRNSSPKSSAKHFISAMKQVLRRSLDSPRSTPGSPVRASGGISRTPALARSGSCLPTISG